jgi:dTMP kinase
MERGKLISFEGIDGCGKTTQLGLLERYLKERNLPFISTREPGGTGIGKKIRAVLLDVSDEAVEPLTEMLLYAADRAQHVRQLVLPALAEGKLVLSDRFFDATTAYQGYGRGFELALVQRLNELATGGLKPDLTLLFDLEVKLGLGRMRQRSDVGQTAEQPDRLDLEPTEFHRRVRQGYLTMAAQEPARIRVIPAAGTIEEVYKLMLAEVESLLAN